MANRHKGRSRLGKPAKDPAQLLQIASQAQASGRLREAEQGYRAFLKLHPDYAPAVHALGLTLRAAGRTKAAISTLVKALRLAPGDVSCRANLANVLREDGQLEDALAQYAKALAEAPDHQNARFNLAVTQFDLQRFEEAAAGFAELLRQHPQDAEVSHWLLSSQLRAGEQARLAARLDDAARCYLAAQALAPDAAEVLIGLGLVARDRQQLRAAYQLFGQALALAPDNSTARLELASAQLGLGEVAAAVSGFTALLERDETHAAAHGGLGAALLSDGDATKAITHLERALELDPSISAVWLQLARARRFSPEDAPIIEALERRLEAPAVGIWDRIDLGFALGKMCDDINVHARAFAHFEKANALVCKHARQPYAPLSSTIDANVAYFSSTRLAARSPLACDSTLPVFVVGMPRSGTTLVEQIVASHPQVYGAGELPHIPRLAAQLDELAGSELPFPACLEHGASEVLRERALAHLDELQTLGTGADRVVDKLPGNFLYLGLIATLFPGARVIWCQREPMATCWSNYTLLFGESHAYSYDLAALGQYYCDYERIMAHWMEVLPLRLHPVVYEQLVADPDGESRRLIDYLGLPWDERCTHFYATRRAVATASNLQVRQPVYKTSVARWRPYAQWLTPLIEALRTDSTGRPA